MSITGFSIIEEVGTSDAPHGEIAEALSAFGSVPSTSLPSSLAFLKDSINEVAYANYYLTVYEHALLEISPKELARFLEPAGPETPAQRAGRLLKFHEQLQHRIQGDLASVVPALGHLAASGVAELEEGVFRSRQTLVEQLVIPNVGVLKLDQDGGVQSPFREMDPEEIVESLLSEPQHDERAMHQAERVLRHCPAVKTLHDDLKKLAELKAQHSCQKALQDAVHAVEDSGRAWALGDPHFIDAGAFSAHQRKLSLLHRELSQKAALLADLQPKLSAYYDPDAILFDKVFSLMRSQWMEDHAAEAPNAPPPSGSQRVARFFRPGSPLGRMADTHGILPVAQALREALAKAIDHHDESPAPASLRLAMASLPDEISAFIRQQVQAAVQEDPAVSTSLTGWAVALCNRGIAEEISPQVTRLRNVLEPDQHTILTGPQAADQIDAAIDKVEALKSKNSRAGRDGKFIRNPVIALLAGLAERIKNEASLVDSCELEFLLDTAVDYLRRRNAFEEQAAARAAYVERGWTPGRRQSRMEKRLGEDQPTTVELGRIDAELTEVFSALQDDVEVFPMGDESPLAGALRVLDATETTINESLRGASEPLKIQLTDPHQSPVIAELLRLTERVRAMRTDDSAALENLSALANELERITGLSASCAIPAESNSAMTLCRKAGLSPRDLVSWRASPDNSLPVFRYLQVQPD